MFERLIKHSTSFWATDLDCCDNDPHVESKAANRFDHIYMLARFFMTSIYIVLPYCADTSKKSRKQSQCCVSLFELLSEILKPDLIFIIFELQSCFIHAVPSFYLCRYKKMMGLVLPISERICYLIEFAVIWLTSLLLTVYPTTEKIVSLTKPEQSLGSVDVPEKMPNSTKLSTHSICFFKNSLLYRNPVASGTFLIAAVLLPFCLMFFFYIKIFKRVRKARVNAWLNRVAQQRCRQTQVIQCGGRKANVFQLAPDPSHDQACRFNRLSYTREKSVLLKGAFSAAVVLLCWLPFASVWLYLSAVGFTFDLQSYIRYLMIISKVSVVLNVLHYICLNVKYRNLYIQTVFGQFTNFLQSFYTDADEHTSQIDSQIVTGQRSSVFEKSAFATKSSKNVLEPIQERQPKDNEEQERNKTNGKTQKGLRSIRRALSLPHYIMSRGIHPDNNSESRNKSNSFVGKRFVSCHSNMSGY